MRSEFVAYSGRIRLYMLALNCHTKNFIYFSHKFFTFKVQHKNIADGAYLNALFAIVQ